MNPVLIVHDNPVMGGRISSLTQEMSMQYVEAETKAEALEMFWQVKPSIVVACEKFSDSHAFELFHELTAQGATEVPFMQVGGGLTIPDLIQSLECGMDDIIPFDDLREKYISRLAFWVASEFAGIPAELRRRALTELKSCDPEEVYSLSDVIELNSELVRETLLNVQNELEEAGEEFGFRYIERVSYLARLTFFLIKNSESFPDFFRFPDMVYVITQGIRSPWKEQIHLFLSRFEELAVDGRFIKAAQEPLSESMVQPVKSMSDF